MGSGKTFEPANFHYFDIIYKQLHSSAGLNACSSVPLLSSFSQGAPDARDIGSNTSPAALGDGAHSHHPEGFGCSQGAPATLKAISSIFIVQLASIGEIWKLLGETL